MAFPPPPYPQGRDLLADRTVVVTAAAGTGIGYAVARRCIEEGASVLISDLHERRLGEAAERLGSETGSTPATLVCDVTDEATVQELFRGAVDELGRIDVLMNNAGVMACPFGHTADGFEMQFGTNHLGHFELTRLLTPAVVAGDAPRIVNLSSAAHGIADVDLDDPNFERTEYNEWVAYGRSKSANALHALALASRLAGDGVLAYSVHPGGIMTNLGRHLNDDLMQQMLTRAQERAEKAGESGGMQFKSIPQGAATQVWAATSPDLVDHSGAYLADCGLGVEGGNTGRNGFEPYIADTSTADRLWDLSERFLA